MAYFDLFWFLQVWAVMDYHYSDIHASYIRELCHLSDTKEKGFGHMELRCWIFQLGSISHVWLCHHCTRCILFPVPVFWIAPKSCSVLVSVGLFSVCLRTSICKYSKSIGFLMYILGINAQLHWALSLSLSHMLMNFYHLLDLVYIMDLWTILTVKNP